MTEEPHLEASARNTYLAIIPARGGSKRLPGKNVLPLGGKPMIAWSVAAALNSRWIEETMVTTDDADIARAAEAAGARVPFLRPAHLASDSATTFDAIEHALAYYMQSGREFEFTVLLQPTSPLRDSRDVDAAIDLLLAKSADAVISVCEMEHSPLWCNTLPPDHSLTGFLAKGAGKRSQDLPQYYRLNGALYVCRTRRLLRERSFFLPDKAFAYVMPRERSVDIDQAMDYLLAKALVEGVS